MQLYFAEVKKIKKLNLNWHYRKKRGNHKGKQPFNISFEVQDGFKLMDFNGCNAPLIKNVFVVICLEATVTVGSRLKPLTQLR